MRWLIPIIMILSTIKPGKSVCNKPNVIWLRGSHGYIHTPEFPNKFTTPQCIHWIIDSEAPYLLNADRRRCSNETSNGKRIRIYLTQLYLNENLTFVAYEKYPYPTDTQLISENEQNSVRPNVKPIDSAYSLTPVPCKINSGASPYVKVYATSFRFLAIQLELTTPYAKHFRIRNFFHVFGFNITYEVTDDKQPLNDFQTREACSMSKCSYAGSCYVDRDYRRFFCDCIPRRHGPYCEYSERCDPERNITFCLNGGTCQMLASGSGVCYCPPGYTGGHCGIKIESSVKECPGPRCKEVCDKGSANTHHPCSCHNGRTIPKEGWMRYEVMVQAMEQVPKYDFRDVSSNISTHNWKRKAEIENSLKGKLRKVPGLEDVDTSLAVVSFGPASQIHFQFFGPNETKNIQEPLKNILPGEPLLPLKKNLSRTFLFSSYPALRLIEVVRESQNELLRAGDPFDLICIAEGSRRVTFNWFKENVPINKLFATREIHEIQHSQRNTFVSKSTLMFTSSTIADRGDFTCQVSDMGEEKCLNITLQVVAPPAVEMEPMSLTLDKGAKDRIILCYSGNEATKHNFTYNWEKNGNPIRNLGHGTNEIIEDVMPFGSILRILIAESSATYTCVVNNFAGTYESSVEVRVLESQYLTFCRDEFDQHHHLWNRTAVGQIAKRRCPRGFSGFRQRTCLNASGQPRWGPSDFSNCISRELYKLSNDILTLKMGFANRTQIFDLTQQLVKHLSRKKFLYRGEGERIIEVLEDIGNYSIQKRDVLDKGDKFLKAFMNATTQLLRFEGSCFLQNSVLRLSYLVQKVATKLPTFRNTFTWSSRDFILQKHQLTSSPFSRTIQFPIPTLNNWLNGSIHIPNNGNESKVNEGAVLVFIAFRNLTSLTSRGSGSSTFKVASPIVSINTLPSGNENRYTMSAKSHVHVRFNISPLLLRRIRNGRVNFTCAGMENAKEGNRISWVRNACLSHQILQNKTIECICEQFGQFGLLIYENRAEPFLAKLVLHWSIILGTVILVLGCVTSILCITFHIKFKFSSDSLYSLKLIICSTLIFCHVFLLSLRIEPYSIPLSTSFCSIVILSLSCQLTKPIAVLVSEQVELYPWLRSVSNLTIISGFFIIFSFPIWTTAAVISHSRVSHHSEQSYGSLLSEESSFFGVFIVIVSLMMTFFMILSFKAFSRLRNSEHSGVSGKSHYIEYRLKILNRALIVTAATLLIMIAGILHLNSPDSLICKYFFGFATVFAGIATLLSYTIKSEYPIPLKLMGCFNYFTEIRDPETRMSRRNMDERTIRSRTPQKYLENGHVSSILIRNCQDPAIPHRERTTTFDSTNSGRCSEADTTMETIGGSSILSMSSGHRDSFILRTSSGSTTDKKLWMGPTSNGTSISRSLTNPSQSGNSWRPLLHSAQQACGGTCKPSRTRRSFSCGGNCAPIKPDRGRCLLREIETAEYVLPSKSVDAACKKQDGTPLQAPSTSKMKPNDLTGYIDVSSTINRKGTQLPELPGGKSNFLLQDPMEGHYESIPSRSGSLKDVDAGENENFESQQEPDPNTSLIPPNLNNGGIREHSTFKQTDPLPPTPKDMKITRQNDIKPQTKAVAKSDPNVQDFLSKDENSLTKEGVQARSSEQLHSLKPMKLFGLT